MTDMAKVREETQAALKKVAEDMKRFHDVHKGKSLVLKPGNKVLVENLNLKTNRPMKKLGDKRVELVEVLKKVGESTYKVKLPRSWKIHDVFNEVLLTKYNDPEFSSQQRYPPLPDVINEEEEFEVEAILDVKYKKPSKDAISKGFTSGVWYLVQWKGYSPTENTWTKKENVENANELITEFHNTHPDKPDKKGQKPNKNNLTRKLEIPMSLCPRELLHLMLPLYDTKDVDEDLPLERDLLCKILESVT